MVPQQDIFRITTARKIVQQKTDLVYKISNYTVNIIGIRLL